MKGYGDEKNNMFGNKATLEPIFCFLLYCSPQRLVHVPLGVPKD